MAQYYTTREELCFDRSSILPALGLVVIGWMFLGSKARKCHKRAVQVLIDQGMAPEEAERQAKGIC